jgi:hypothetical protein
MDKNSEEPKCSVPEYTEKHYKKGYCIKHFWRWKRYGDPTATRLKKICKICGEKHFAKDFCKRCYYIDYWEKYKGKKKADR